MRFVFDPFELDEPTLELRRRGEPVAIGAQALSLVLHLIRHRDRVVGREELHELLWKGATVGETSLGQAVRHARKALGNDGGAQNFIRNVRGRGYRFAAEVEEVAEADRESAAAVPESAAATAGDPFFGREAEITLLDAALELTRGGQGDAIWIAGEEGVGKTRILVEHSRRAQAAGARVLQSGCIDGVWASPYGPFAELIAATRRLDAAELAWNTLGEDADVLTRVADAGGAAASASDEPTQPREEERLRLFDAICRLFESLAAKTPLVICIDDLHWADAATLALAHHVARRAATGGWLLVGTLREGERDSAESPRLTSLQQTGARRAPQRLSGLGRQDTARLLESIAGRSLPAGLVDDIQNETGGNPFFAREILRHLLEEGSLVDERGEWSESLRLDELSMPDGVRQVLSRRLAGLGPAGRELLTAASASRGTFHFEVVRRAAQLTEAAALDGLDETLDAGILRETGEAEVYGFSHDLTRRVLYFEQSPARRVRLHRRLAESLVSTHGPRAGEHAERIARQYRASAGLPGAEAGVPHCLLAADRAAAVSAWEDEAAFVEMALDLMLPDDRRRLLLLERQGLALAFSGATSEAARAASEAAAWIEDRKGRAAAADYLVNVVTGVAWGASKLAWDLSEKARGMVSDGDPLSEARLRLVELWRDAAVAGQPVDSPEQRAVTVATLDNWSSLDDARKNGLSMVGLAFSSREEVLSRAGDTAVFLALWAGEYEQAIPRFAHDVREAETHAEIAGAYFYLGTTARLQAALGRLDDARATFARSEAHLEGLPVNPHFEVVRASIRTELAHAEGTGFAEVAPVFEELAQNADLASQWLMPTVMCVGAEVFAHAGRRDEALRMLEVGLPGMVRSPGWMTSFTLMVNSAVGALWQLECDDWVGLLEKQLQEKTLSPDFRFPSTDARLSMARLCALQERFEEATEWFERAREVLDAQGARPLRAVCDLDEARMWQTRGEPGDDTIARDRLHSALGQFGAIGMDGWTARGEAWGRESGLVEDPSR